MTKRILALLLLVGALPAVTLVAQSPDELRVMRSSAAATTTLVLMPALTFDLFRVRGALQAGVTYGGEVDWIPRLPVVVNIAGFRAMDGGGMSLHSSAEAGVAWRMTERLVVADKNIFVEGRQTRDSVFSTFLVGKTVVRKYVAVRGGLVGSWISESGTTLNPSASRAFYFGISRNELANDRRGKLGLKWIKTLAVDVLVGSADTSSFSRYTNKIGFRGIVRTDFNTGSIITSRMELGSRPGQGPYAAVTIDFNVMFRRVLGF